ncbi:MAG: bacteriohemerythrin [Verrucomicrobiota bacterium]
MSIRTGSSIPRQLLLLLGLAAAVTLAAAALYYTTSSRAFKDTAAITQSAVEKLDRAYQLLERVSGDLGDLQQLLRQKDPDQIEKNLADLEKSRKEAARLVEATGPGGAAVKSKFEILVQMEKAVTDEFLQGNAGLAYEKYLQTAAPQGNAVIEEVQRYHDGIEKATHAEVAAQQAAMISQLRWRSLTLAVVLAFVLAGGWRLKNRITRSLLDIASGLADVSDNSTRAAEQVSQGSQSLAEGASEQAASLEETSASLEELASMTRRNAENAQRANELSREARGAADKGAVDMQSMSAAMETIKRSSDDIAKIIKTIDEIAFQTNILALNAAVEAARAGEAGMGFAVVADEVRSLAQRSAQAARETAAKIEGAIANTAQGVEISSKVANALNDIVAKARQVDELAAEVANASREQTQGIGQINTAVGEMDKVTQRNAANAEESAAAAQELNGQARIMRDSVNALLQLVGARAGDRAILAATHTEAAFSLPAADTAALPEAPARSVTPAGSPSGDLVVWDEERMTTGVEAVDDEHKELIRMINELHQACREGRGKTEVQRMMGFLGQYVQTHFKHEEGIMEKTGCPVRAKNKLAHEAFLRNFQKLATEFETKGESTAVLLDLRKMVGDWLTNHICSVDTKLRLCREHCGPRHEQHSF